MRQVRPGTTIDIEQKAPSSFGELSSVEIGSRGVISTSSSSLARRLFHERREGILKHDLDGVGAAAAFRRAAERRVDVADPRTGYSGYDRASHLTVAEDVTATDDHGVLLTGKRFSLDAIKPTAAIARPSAAPVRKPSTETMFWSRLNGRGLTSSLKPIVKAGTTWSSPLDNHSTNRHSPKTGSFASILIPVEYDVGQPHALSSARQARSGT